MNYKTTSPGKLLITSEYFVLKGGEKMIAYNQPII